MKILLIGGGSGGHITPLLAVAHELRVLQPDIELIGVCEKNANFVHLYEEDSSIDKVIQISAGKYRRYSGISITERLSDVKTPLLNIRDAGRTIKGYREALRALKQLKPDAMLIKGGFVGVPMGLAASKLGVPYLTHDSDSVPGLANKLVARWASLHATGMPIELYDYPKSKSVFTGIPVSTHYKRVSSQDRRQFREDLNIGNLNPVIMITGGSQGGAQLNLDVVKVTAKLIEQFPNLGVLHIAGSAKEEQVRSAYARHLSVENLPNIVVKGFVNNLHSFSGAADIVISRASATAIAEFSLQGLPIILVPGRLSGGHQDKNAAYFAGKQAALVAEYG
ncbi:MAG: UDP-N-acetylglucosamine--N-acetylmuramyl-(pentapeptide) pyrophosphoryl-undecaprenol N-acetylglucosamine transferase, partial [bacterium]|nr:UDP-N-acetylglucosamine--N-acetylmuramyl-(pentapeptide) pyrophosphoryl-undecaprenol N-acetylglucosamine transferase [bacterium]